jgi:hypothetical protein
MILLMTKCMHPFIVHLPRSSAEDWQQWGVSQLIVRNNDFRLVTIRSFLTERKPNDVLHAEPGTAPLAHVHTLDRTPVRSNSTAEAVVDAAADAAGVARAADIAPQRIAALALACTRNQVHQGEVCRIRSSS